MGSKMVPLWGNMITSLRNKNLKPGQSPQTVDQIFANNPGFLAKYHKSTGTGPILGASTASAANPEDVRKRLAAQLGGGTIIGANSDALGG